jgi:hypothetical protein
MPEHADATNQTAGNIVSYLNSIKADTTLKAPLDSKPVLTLAQKQYYNKALDLAEQPLMILDSIKKGTATAEDLKTVSHMYPGLMQRITQKLMSAMTEHISKGATVPYRTRIGLSLVMGQPLDSSMSPSSIVAAQIAPVAPQQQPQQVQSKGGVKSSPALQKMPNSYKTSDQAREARQNKE